VTMTVRRARNGYEECSLRSKREQGNIREAAGVRHTQQHKAAPSTPPHPPNIHTHECVQVNGLARLQHPTKHTREKQDTQAESGMTSHTERDKTMTGKHGSVTATRGRFGLCVPMTAARLTSNLCRVSD
jgi:hypothetical protein